MSEHPRRAAERLHDERHIYAKRTGAHVYQVWSDGEITSTKGGDLFGQRSLHRIEWPFIPKERDPRFFPVERNETSYAIVEGNEQAYELQDILMEWWTPVMQERIQLIDRIRTKIFGEEPN